MSDEILPPKKISSKKTPRVQLSHALIDVDFFHKPTIKALRRRFSFNGLVAYLEIILQISRASNALLTRDSLLQTVEECGIIESDEYLKYCLEEGLLDGVGTKITQRRVAEDQEKLALKRQVTANRVKKWREGNQEELDGEGNALRTRYTSVTPVTVTVTDPVLDLNKDLIQEEVSTRSAVPLYPGCSNTRISDIGYQTTLKTYIDLGLDKADLAAAIVSYDAWKGRKILDGTGNYASIIEDSQTLCSQWILREAIKLKSEITKLKGAARRNIGTTAVGELNVNWEKVFK